MLLLKRFSQLENAKNILKKRARIVVANKSDLIDHLLILLNEVPLLESMDQNIKKLTHWFLQQK